MVDDLLAPEGGKDAARWKRKRRRVKALKVQPYKRPICVHFPIATFLRIQNMAIRNNLSFTAQAVELCEKGLKGKRRG